MKKIRIRFNKNRGQAGKGTAEHVWRVFEGDKEYLVKNFKINVLSEGQKDPYTEDWNVVCFGVLSIDRNTSTAIINPQ